jgi:hypothetical protein
MSKGTVPISTDLLDLLCALFRFATGKPPQLLLSEQQKERLPNMSKMIAPYCTLRLTSIAIWHIRYMWYISPGCGLKYAILR